MVYFPDSQVISFSSSDIQERSMRFSGWSRILFPAIVVLITLCLGSLTAPAQSQPNTGAKVKATSHACPNDDSGLKLPAGFCATVFADDIGHARHLVVAPSGVVYVNTWLGSNDGTAGPPAGGFLVALRDTRGAGTADVRRRFGATVQDGARGGTGIGWYDGALYAETGDSIVRYRLSRGSTVPSSAPETIVSGLPIVGDHTMHPFAIDPGGSL